MAGKKIASRVSRHAAASQPSTPVSQSTYPAGSLLSVTHLSLEEIGGILAAASELEAAAPRDRATLLEGRKAALLFYESSTRTRTSFELAAKSLGVVTTLVSDKSSSIEKGESLKDTGITLRALGAECIILRHLSSGSPYLLARETGLPVLNAGDGMHEHPSQALLDLRTMLARLRLAPVSRNATAISKATLRGVALLLPRLGARVILCGPHELLPDEAETLGPGVSIERDFDKALARADVAMMLRIQTERLAGLKLNLQQYTEQYQLHAERLALYAPHAVVLHPGPMNRGLEITSEVADGPQSMIEEQVRHGVAIRMALLVRALQPGTQEARA